MKKNEHGRLERRRTMLDLGVWDRRPARRGLRSARSVGSGVAGDLANERAVAWASEGIRGEGAIGDLKGASMVWGHNWRRRSVGFLFVSTAA